MGQSLAGGNKIPQAGQHGQKETKTNSGLGELKTSCGESKRFLGTMKVDEWALRRIGWRYESGTKLVWVWHPLLLLKLPGRGLSFIELFFGGSVFRQVREFWESFSRICCLSACSSKQPKHESTICGVARPGLLLQDYLWPFVINLFHLQ